MVVSHNGARVHPPPGTKVMLMTGVPLRLPKYLEIST